MHISLLHNPRPCTSSCPFLQFMHCAYNLFFLCDISSSIARFRQTNQIYTISKTPLLAAPMDQRNHKSSSKSPPRPSYAAKLARGSLPPSPPPTILARITYDPVIVDPIDGHLAHLPNPPLGLRPEVPVNPREIAYKTPARYKVSIETFADAAA